MVGIQENHASWTYWDEYIQYLMNKNKTVRQISENLKKERSRKLKRIKDFIKRYKILKHVRFSAKTGDKILIQELFESIYKDYYTGI